MKLADRITEARGLCGDIERDLSRVEELRGARNPEPSAEVLFHIRYVTLQELRDHVMSLVAHYEHECDKAAKKAGRR